MSQKRLATFTLTSSYQNLSTLLGSSAFNSRVFDTGSLRCASAAANGARVSIIESGTTGSDSLSILLAAGEYLPFSEMDLRQVWAKGDGGASTLEFEADEH